MPIPFAIKVGNISKHYRLGEHAQNTRTFRDVITDSFDRLNSLSRSKKNGQQRRETDLWALSDVNFEVRPGEAVGIIGRNGSGKSTLLKIISRITEPTTGRVEIYGRVGSLLEVGTGFHPELSGRDNIFLNGSILGMSRREIEKAFDEIVTFAELEKFLDTPVKRYSSGMYIRLAFAVAAHLAPEIMLIDEVLAVGDAAFQKKCLGKMNDVARHGRTILFVSHNTAAMLNLCERALLLEHGKIVADGRVEAVIHQYLQSLKLASPYDLKNCSERQGNGRVRFTSARFEDERGNIIEQGVSGYPLVIALDYQSPNEQSLPNCRSTIVFLDAMGQFLFNCTSDLVISDPLTLPPSGTLRCLIPRLPLSQGQYLLNLMLAVNGEIEDRLHNAIELEVSDGDFFGTGRLYLDGWRGRGVLVDHEWMVD
jgi:lipopolysaccharide transport system ATP-binding protein